MGATPQPTSLRSHSYLRVGLLNQTPVVGRDLWKINPVICSKGWLKCWSWFVFQVSTRVESAALPAQPRAAVSCVYRAALPAGPREGFLQHKLCLSPPGFSMVISSISTLSSISTFSLPTPLADPAFSSSPQAGGSSSLSPDPPHEQTHRAAGPGFTCGQVLPHVAG